MSTEKLDGKTRTPEELAEELRNFEEIASKINPSREKIPQLAGVDIHGKLMPLRSSIGGDHILYVDFNRRYDLDARIKEAEAEGRGNVADELRSNKQRAGILVADVSGHHITDAVIAAMLHQSFLLGTLYELDMFGEITTRLFEHLNTRFYKTTSVNKYFTMIYGEISDRGRFRFISAGHELPIIVSRLHRKVMQVSLDRIVSFPPIGMLPSAEAPELTQESLIGYKKRYTMNEINLLGSGDVLMLYTDGLSQFADGEFFANELERCLLDTMDDSSETVCSVMADRIRKFGSPDDDISFVVIKKR
ncbi:MAG: PP2C family protein-serine/threonine phosphatase [Acidobacteriota bacterium]|nr:PP2C family protein-serine/threonine phosphatase [Acidobacteriota bacterium]